MDSLEIDRSRQRRSEYRRHERRHPFLIRIVRSQDVVGSRPIVIEGAELLL